MSTVVEKSPLSTSTPGIFCLWAVFGQQEASTKFQRMGQDQAWVCSSGSLLLACWLTMTISLFEATLPSWNSLLQLLREQFSLQLPYSPPFDLQSQDGTDLTVSSKMVPLYPQEFPLIQLLTLKIIPLLKFLQLPHFIVPSVSCQDPA